MDQVRDVEKRQVSKRLQSFWLEQLEKWELFTVVGNLVGKAGLTWEDQKLSF